MVQAVQAQYWLWLHLNSWLKRDYSTVPACTVAEADLAVALAVVAWPVVAVAFEARSHSAHTAAVDPDILEAGRTVQADNETGSSVEGRIPAVAAAAVAEAHKPQPSVLAALHCSA